MDLAREVELLDSLDQTSKRSWPSDVNFIHSVPCTLIQCVFFFFSNLPDRSRTPRAEEQDVPGVFPDQQSVCRDGVHAAAGLRGHAQSLYRHWMLHLGKELLGIDRANQLKKKRSTAKIRRISNHSLSNIRKNLSGKTNLQLKLTDSPIYLWMQKRAKLAFKYRISS